MKERVLKLLEARLFIVNCCVEKEIDMLPFGLDWPQMCSLSPELADYSQQQKEIEEAINWVKSL